VPVSTGARGFVPSGAMQGATVEDQATGLIRATATNAEMVNVFASSIGRGRDMNLDL
jgi:hypothetical protein